MSGDSRTTWILESNVFSEKCFDEMVAHLTAQRYPHHIVRIIPFSHEVVGGIPKVDGPCVVYGSLGIQKLAAAQGWIPGVWTSDDFSSTVYAERLEDLFLNHDLVSCPLTRVEENVAKLGWQSFFIKPNSDGKAFPGSVVEVGEITRWVEQLRSSGLLEDNDVEVVIAAPHLLGREWRTVVVGGKVAAYSLYKQHRRVWTDRSIEPAALTIAHRAAERFSPADVFVADIAETADGMRIIEYNTFNSAGLYACDVAAVIDRVSGWVEKRV